MRKEVLYITDSGDREDVCDRMVIITRPVGWQWGKSETDGVFYNVVEMDVTSEEEIEIVERKKKLSVDLSRFISTAQRYWIVDEEPIEG